MPASFTNEADLVRTFVSALKGADNGRKWTVYPESGGYDLLLQHVDGYQLGLEAKLKLNPKVVEQALQGATCSWTTRGPDYRAVLVPEDGLQNHMGKICIALGIGVISVRPDARHYSLNLPDESHDYGMRDWANWCPDARLALPEYMPDVEGGKPSPLMLTPWKIKAIKLLIVLERRGYVARDDLKRLSISATIWTQHRHGFLEKGPAGYVRSVRTPNLQGQHPQAWAEIEADAEVWLTKLGIALPGGEQGKLL
jgi:hypothetical protein